MNEEDFKKGILFGIAGVFLIGLQPIVANARPASIDSYLFAAMTILIEALLFFPIMLGERSRLRSKQEQGLIELQEMESLINGWKKPKNIALIIYVGLTFAIAQILFFVGYREAGAINGSLTQKTTVIFGLLFGYLINKEEVRPSQVVFSFLLLLGLALAITEGSLNLLEFNVGVLVLLIMAILWMLAHAITRPIFQREEATPIQMVFTRNAIGAAFLLATYFLFYPPENFQLFFDPINIFFFIAMGVNYGVGLYCWYKVLAYIGTSKGTALVSGTPIITAIFATIFLGELFTIWHFIGLLIVVISVIMIVRPKIEETPNE